MSKPSKESMPRFSMIVVYALPFLRALKAVLAFADRKHDQLSVVRITLPEMGDQMFVTAANLKHMAMCEMSTHFTDIEDERHRVIALDMRDVKELIDVATPRGEKTEDPLLGMRVSDQWVEITDESGMGLGLKRLRLNLVELVHYPAIPDAISKAFGSPPGKESWLDADQLAALKTAAKALGEHHMILRPLEAGDGFSRVLATGGGDVGIAALSVCFSPSKSDSRPEGDQEQESIPIPDVTHKPLRIVQADPPQAT